MARPPKPVTMKSLRVRVTISVGGIVAFGFYVYNDLHSVGYPPIWVAGALGALALISHLISRTVGFNLKPVPVGTPPAEAMALATRAVGRSTTLRCWLSEAVEMSAIFLCYAVLPSTWMTYLIGATLGFVLLAVNAWPSTAVINKAQQQLDRDGGRSFLSDALLGLAPSTAAPADIHP